MDKKRFWKALLVGVLVLFSILYILPTLVPSLADSSWYPFSKRLNFGLDIKGGLELRYTVDYKKAVLENSRDLMLRSQDYLVRAFREANKGKEREDWNNDRATEEELAALAARATFSVPVWDTVKVETTDSEIIDTLAGDLKDAIDARYVVVPIDGGIEIKMKAEEVKRLKTDVVDQTLSIIRKRVDAFGLVEPDVRISGESDIDVQLPGVSQAQMDMVRERIGQTARLTFRIVDTTDLFASAGADIEAFKRANPEKGEGLATTTIEGRTQVKSPKKSNLVAFVHFMQRAGKISDRVTVGYYFIEEREKGQVVESYYRTETLSAEARVTGEHLSRARVYFDQQAGNPYVSLDFTTRGGQLFEALTGENVDKNLAIMLDDDINSAPTIKEKIGGGSARITMGGYNPQQQLEEAQSLTTVLTHGAYKAPVHKIADNVVGPTLGQDAIDAGVLAFIVGAVLVFLFMVFYYRQAGIVADVALVINIIFILATLIAFNSALTLPGLAGIVLTIGMAVDANVLIYERIREEIRAGKPPRAAIETGFQKSTWTILDSQLTTALAGVILLNFTTGPIYGFAVTLLIGIIFSVITALWICRMIYGWMLDRKIIKDQVSI